MKIRENDHFLANGEWSYTEYLDEFQIPEDDGTRPIKYNPYEFFVSISDIYVNAERGEAEIFCYFYKTLKIVNGALPESDFTFYETKRLGQIGYKIISPKELAELVTSGKLLLVHREGYEHETDKKYFR